MLLGALLLATLSTTNASLKRSSATSLSRAPDKGLTVVIIGASRGLGLELTRSFASRGAAVHAAARSPSTSLALTQLQASYPSRISLHTLDVTRVEQIASVAAKLAGIVKSVDIVLHVAGINVGSLAEQQATNLEAPFNVAAALVPLVRKSTRMPHVMGIVTTSPASPSALEAVCKSSTARPGGCEYGKTKAAAHARFRQLAPEWAKQGVTGIVIDPGFMRTQMNMWCGASQLKIGQSCASGDPTQKGKVTPTESAEGIRRLLKTLKADGGGKLWSYRGKVRPWGR